MKATNFLPIALSFSSAIASRSQFYLAQSSLSASSAADVTGKEFNSILSHLLDVSYFNDHDFNSQAKIESTQVHEILAEDYSGTQKILILIEDDYNSAIPAQFATSSKLNIPDLRIESYYSLLSLHFNRLVKSLGLNDAQYYGLDSFNDRVKEIAGWRNWISKELGDSIGWKDVKITQIETVSPNAGLLTDLDLLDESADLLISEMQGLTALVDSLQAGSDNGMQSGKQIIAIHIRGLKKILESHSHTSTAYRSASQILQKYLTATIDSLVAVEKSTLMLITLPSTPYSPSLLSLKKKQPWLNPFIHQSKTLQANFPSTHSKRALGSSATTQAKRVRVPIVPSSFTCFNSAQEVNEATNSCNAGNGLAVKGVSALMTKNREECWVCSCSPTMVGGKKINWGGQGCEKVDLSSDFTLLFFTSLGLLITLLASVMLLSAIGSIELPGTLASVNGSGAGGKKA